MIQALRFSETSVLTRFTWGYITEDDIFHSHRRENLKSYKIYRFVAVVYYHYHIYGHYSSSSLLFEMHLGDWILAPSSDGAQTTNESQYSQNLNICTSDGHIKGQKIRKTANPDDLRHLH
jgi:hypothetical protein